jgi:hypothetical protein
MSYRRNTVKIFSTLAFTLLSALALVRVQAADHTHHAGHAAHLGQAPAGVMGDHVHSSGDLMFSYSYMRMHMEGMRDGDDHVSTASVLSEYMVAPLRMDMEMHMFGAMYAVNERLSLMAMLPLVRKDMDHITRMGVRFTTRSDGVGDVSLRGVYVLSTTRRQNLFLNLGLSAPTGDIDASDDTPAASNAQLPYPMQPGSVSATHQQLASELGTAREVVSRQLKAFERAGLVAVHRGAVEVLKPDALIRVWGEVH